MRIQRQLTLAIISALAVTMGVLYLIRDGADEHMSIEVTDTMEVQAGDVWPSVAFSPDGKKLVFNSSVESFSIMDTDTSEIRQVPGGGIWGAFAFSPGGKVLAAVDGDKLLFYDPVTAEVIRTVDGVRGEVLSVAYSADGKTLAYRTNDKVFLLDVASGVVNDSFSVCKGDQLAFSPVSDLLAYNDYTEQRSNIAIIDVSANTPEDKIRGAQIFRFAPDGGLLAFARGRAVRFWDIEKGRMLRQKVDWKGLGHPGCFTFSPDGRLLASGGNDCREESWLARFRPRPREGVGGRVVLSETQTGRRLWMWHEDYVGPAASMDFSPDGETLAVGILSNKSKIMLWRVDVQEKSVSAH